jgi:hypothetical protein
VVTTVLCVSFQALHTVVFESTREELALNTAKTWQRRARPAHTIMWHCLMPLTHADLSMKVLHASSIMQPWNLQNLVQHSGLYHAYASQQVCSVAR